MAASRIDALLQFMRQSPADPFPRYALALEYKNAGRMEDARSTFADLIASHPDYTATYLHAGNVLRDLDRPDEARQTYRDGIAVCNRSGDAHSRGELEGALSALGDAG